MAETGTTVRMRRLGATLRDARDSKGLTREEVAKIIDVSVSTLTRIESGRVGLRLYRLRELMNLLGIEDSEERKELESFATVGRRQRGWWQGKGLRPTYSHFIGLEAEATRRYDFAAVVVPSLLQTPAYARAVIGATIPPHPEEVVDRLVNIRLQRQDLLRRGDRPLRLHAVLDESCIYRRIGGKDTYLGQLEFLLKINEARRNVMIQVLPHDTGVHASALGGFVLLEYRHDPRVAYIELDAGDLYAEGPEADLYYERFVNLQAVALSPSSSMDLIRRTREDVRLWR